MFDKEQFKQEMEEKIKNTVSVVIESKLRDSIKDDDEVEEMEDEEDLDEGDSEEDDLDEEESDDDEEEDLEEKKGYSKSKK